MKYLSYIGILLCSTLFCGCEEVIDVSLENQEKRVVIDALLREEDGKFTIKMNHSAEFFDEAYQPIASATIQVTDLNTQEVYPFVYVSEGAYENQSMPVIAGHTYRLDVQYENTHYEATTTVIETPEISTVEQETTNLFGQEVIQLKFFYQDNPDEKNYYLFTQQFEDEEQPQLQLREDTFDNGNLSFDLVIVDLENQGKVLNYSITSLSEPFYYFTKKVLTNMGQSGNPFAVPTGTIRGNIENTTDKEAYPFGYFYISKPSSIAYEVQ